MPTWNEIDAEITGKINQHNPASEVCDSIRHHYLSLLSKRVKKPVIAYYSGFLQKPLHPEVSISDFDMNGMMAVVHNLPRDQGLDLILHTPGGGIEAARALVEYLYSMFGKDIRIIVPQLAMSAGTMIACAAKSIVLGKHSCLGPTDPQVNGTPAMGVIEEIKVALDEIATDPRRALLWQEVFRKYPPAFIANCERSIAGTKDMVTSWLEGNMFINEDDPNIAAKNVVGKLTNFKDTTEHGHHFLKDKCIEFGLAIEELEKDQKLQEAVLSVHHCYVASFARVKTIKFIENSLGASWNVAESI